MELFKTGQRVRVVRKGGWSYDAVVLRDTGGDFVEVASPFKTIPVKQVSRHIIVPIQEGEA